MEIDDAYNELPKIYTLALRLRAGGMDDAGIASHLGIEPESAPSLLRLAEAKLTRIRRGTELTTSMPSTSERALMSINEDRFVQLFRRLAEIDLFGSGPPDVPWHGDPPSADTFRSAIKPASGRLPLSYQRAYINPLLQHLDRVLNQLTGAPDILESIGGAIFDHRVAETDPELDRFLAVISNFYRSFLDQTRRAPAGFPEISEQLPPLAMFQHSGRMGPFTLPVNAIAQLFGGSVGVVSMPSTYRNHPLLWASLAHETGGHDVLHADEGLLPELGESVRALFGAGPISADRKMDVNQFLGLLWSYWIDEAASDVYGVMNIGPEFGLNLVAFFAALGERHDPTGVPSLRTDSGPDPSGLLDPHPTDILRPFLIKGATEALQGLSADRRDGYAEDLARLARLTGGDADIVHIQGLLPVGPGVALPVNVPLPLELMRSAAERVGALIATGTFTALGGHSIQDLETWDDADEDTALRIAEGMKAGTSVAHQGDDAALLAGATLAAFDQPGSYDTITARLNEALDASFATDPIWGTPTPDHSFVVTTLLPDDSPALEHYLTVS
ncbi:MAG TPA: hypothetical protein VFO16_22845 [Pseudonocardiaceae bacterium]|nr:hypothetical protein [Pseudonocardiaceae bacterium]